MAELLAALKPLLFGQAPPPSAPPPVPPQRQQPPVAVENSSALANRVASSGLEVAAHAHAIKSEAHTAVKPEASANIKTEDMNGILDALRGVLHANTDKDNAVMLTAAAAAAAVTDRRRHACVP